MNTKIITKSFRDSSEELISSTKYYHKNRVCSEVVHDRRFCFLAVEAGCGEMDPL